MRAASRTGAERYGGGFLRFIGLSSDWGACVSQQLRIAVADASVRRRSPRAGSLCASAQTTADKVRTIPGSLVLQGRPMNFHALASASALCVGVALTAQAAPSAMSHESSRESAGVELKMAMRKLWEEHIVYTRNYIISALAGLPDGDAVAQRLLGNQDDIGNAVKPYYGDAAGKKLSALLRDHILIATEVVKAAKAGDKPQLAKAQVKWTANGKDIAAFLIRRYAGRWNCPAVPGQIQKLAGPQLSLG